MTADAWRDVLVSPGVFLGEDRTHRPPGLGALVPAFLDWQAQKWPRLGQARAALGSASQRKLGLGARELTVQLNPGRNASTTAQVDPDSVRERPCFLCPANLPPEEKGLAFGHDLVLLPNPAPILPLHLSIAHREHRPQALAGCVGDAVALALAAAGSLTLLYNGPQCGASAPDHLHLQAFASGSLPEERAVVSGLGAQGLELPAAELARKGELRAWSLKRTGRAEILLHGSPRTVEQALHTTLEALARLTHAPREPLLNLLLWARDGQVTALVFPRGAHRPACYHAGDCLVSPGAIDMGGHIVIVRSEDFEKVDEELVGRIFEETSLDASGLQRLEQDLTARWSRG